MIYIFYPLAILALAVGAASIYMAFLKPFPVQWLYYHYFARKPVVWIIFLGTMGWILGTTWQTGTLPTAALPPLAIMGLAVGLTYKMHQENVFRAVDFPAMAEDIFSLPLRDDMQLAIIEYGGVSKAYPLDGVIHHHIVNDRFGDHIVALTYCAMCHTVIPFDVTDIGPLFVASFKNANMIVADRKTSTFFQQATFASIIGQLHPARLTMIPFQVLPWGEIKKLREPPQVMNVSATDLREFELPIPGIWRKILASEATPGLTSKDRDNSFPVRTRVVRVGAGQRSAAYLKDELMKRGLTTNEELDIFLVAVSDTVNGFRNSMGGRQLRMRLDPEPTLTDLFSGTVWDIRGKYVRGKMAIDLEPVVLSDEYWFAWKRFHPTSELIRL